jgi:hypothetical protein
VYQLEVKRWLVFHKFPVGDNWDVTIDIDAMERGKKGQHPPEKQAKAAECELWLRSQGVKIATHPLYGRADLVAHKEGVGTFVAEVEGDSARQKEQAMYSALSQVILSMRDVSPDITYALAVPDTNKWAAQLSKVPSNIRKLLRLELWLVSEAGVRSVEVWSCLAEETVLEDAGSACVAVLLARGTEK